MCCSRFIELEMQSWQEAPRFVGDETIARVSKIPDGMMARQVQGGASELISISSRRIRAYGGTGCTTSVARTRRRETLGEVAACQLDSKPRRFLYTHNPSRLNAASNLRYQ
jgi:hypothetical protein